MARLIKGTPTRKIAAPQLGERVEQPLLSEYPTPIKLDCVRSITDGY
jgi:hypothetical protein